QGRQRAHGSPRSARPASVTAIPEKRQGSNRKDKDNNKKLAAAFPWRRRPAADPSTPLAVGRESEPDIGASRQSTHAASLLRHAHGGERRRPPYSADHPPPLRHIDHADLYPRSARPPEERVRETSSA